MDDDEPTYTVFHRTWWKENARWSGGREPQIGDKHILATGLTYAEAREHCEEWNAEHDPGPLSDKAEFTRE